MDACSGCMCVCSTKVCVFQGKRVLDGDNVGHQCRSAYGLKEQGCTVLQQEPRAGLYQNQSSGAHSEATEPDPWGNLKPKRKIPVSNVTEGDEPMLGMLNVLQRA